MNYMWERALIYLCLKFHRCIGWYFWGTQICTLEAEVIAFALSVALSLTGAFCQLLTTMWANKSSLASTLSKALCLSYRAMKNVASFMTAGLLGFWKTGMTSGHTYHAFTTKSWNITASKNTEDQHVSAFVWANNPVRCMNWLPPDGMTLVKFYPNSSQACVMKSWQICVTCLLK